MIRILASKELKTNFDSWGIYVGYLIFFCICGFYSWFSGSNLFYQGQPTMMPVFMIVNWTQFFLIPALTMRSIAEEKRSGTIELILTKPIKTAELISGKFLAYLTITVIALLLTLPYYITISALGTIDHGAVFLGYLGLICMSACHISIGIFASSLSRTVVTSFFLSFGLSFCFQSVFESLAEQFNSGFTASVFSYLSMQEHFDSLSRGILDSRDIIYFVSICTIFLSLSKFFICKSRF